MKRTNISCIKTPDNKRKSNEGNRKSSEHHGTNSCRNETLMEFEINRGFKEKRDSCDYSLGVSPVKCLLMTVAALTHDRQLLDAPSSRTWSLLLLPLSVDWT